MNLNHLFRCADARASACFPRTLALMEAAVGDRLVGITFSQLMEESDIAPHVGDTNGNYRCHLGLIVPSPLPTCGMRVGLEEQSWREGRVMAFNDAHHHTAWNGSKEKRFILLFDVMREEYMASKLYLCRSVMAAFLVHRLSNWYPWVSSTPRRQLVNLEIVRFLLHLPITFDIGSAFVHQILRA